MYVDPNIVEANLLHRKEAIRLGGGKEKLDIMFIDLRNFTKFSQNHSSEEIANMLNIYFSFCESRIHYYQGTIDKFMGDGVLSFFGDPIKQEDPLEKAIKCAIDIQKVLKKHKSDIHYLQAGISIHYGDVLVGNFGCSSHLDYTVIGHNVNVGSRLIDFAKEGEIIISEKVNNIIDENYKTEFIKKTTVKGLNKELEVYKLL